MGNNVYKSKVIFDIFWPIYVILHLCRVSSPFVCILLNRYHLEVVSRWLTSVLPGLSLFNTQGITISDDDFLNKKIIEEGRLLSCARCNTILRSEHLSPPPYKGVGMILL